MDRWEKIIPTDKKNAVGIISSRLIKEVALAMAEKKQRKISKGRIVLAAPIGRTARRMAEVTGLLAFTSQKLLAISRNRKL